jgi:small subunit ribosomal protein S3
MGQKVNPVGMRIGISRDWNSKWYANKKDFANFLNEDYKVRTYLSKDLKDALLSHIEIERSKGVVVVSIFTAKPGVVLGQDGAKIKELQKKVSKMVSTGNAKLSVVEVKNPSLDANIIAQDMAAQLEARASFRNVQKKAIQRVMKAGAMGIKTSISGRLAGADIARSEGYKEGVVSLHTLRMDVDYALAEAATTYGKLGCKVWICRGVSKKFQKADKQENSGKKGE